MHTVTRDSCDIGEHESSRRSQSGRNDPNKNLAVAKWSDESLDRRLITLATKSLCCSDQDSANFDAPHAGGE